MIKCTAVHLYTLCYYSDYTSQKYNLSFFLFSLIFDDMVSTNFYYYIQLNFDRSGVSKILSNAN